MNIDDFFMPPADLNPQRLGASSASRRPQPRIANGRASGKTVVNRAAPGASGAARKKRG